MARNSKKQGAQGEASGSQKKKSAASAKPASKAAASVHVAKKPVTEREKNAAQKRHEHEEQVRAAERIKRSMERETAAYEASGVRQEPVAKDNRGIIGSVIDYFRDIIGIEKKSDAPIYDQTTDVKTEASKARETTVVEPERKGLFGGSKSGTKKKYDLPQTPEYKRLKNIYWGLLCIALLAILGPVLLTLEGYPKNWFWYGMLGLGYATGIAAIILDFAKIKPIVKEHQKKSGKKKTPKQIKHEIQAVSAARQPSRAPGTGGTGKQQAQSKSALKE